MIPVVIDIPLPFGLHLPAHSFGLLMVLCFLAGWKRLYLSLAEAGEDPALAERMITWAAIGGILGARLFYVLSFPEELIHNPLRAIFSGAGFVFYGGFLGGAFAVWLLLRRVGRPFWHFSDLTAPTLALGYAVGRVGCQLSGDGDYGIPSTVPWAMSYSLGIVPTPAGVLVHPTPVYETFMALVITYVLLMPAIKKLLGLPGQRFGLYLILSAIARFVVEELRIEPRVWGSLTQAQVTGLVLALCGIILIIWPRRSRA